jgi:hypothetical protein
MQPIKSINKNHPNSTIPIKIKYPHQSNNTNNQIKKKSIDNKCKPKCKDSNNLSLNSKKITIINHKLINKDKKPIKHISLKLHQKISSTHKIIQHLKI